MNPKVASHRDRPLLFWIPRPSHGAVNDSGLQIVGRIREEGHL